MIAEEDADIDAELPGKKTMYIIVWVWWRGVVFECVDEYYYSDTTTT